MKKTVIKRRKRVPALGSQPTANTTPNKSNPTTTENSPANPPLPMPHTPATATVNPPLHVMPPGPSSEARSNSDPVTAQASSASNRPTFPPYPVSRNQPWWMKDSVSRTPVKTEKDLAREREEEQKQRATKAGHPDVSVSDGPPFLPGDQPFSLPCQYPTHRIAVHGHPPPLTRPPEDLPATLLSVWLLLSLRSLHKGTRPLSLTHLRKWLIIALQCCPLD
jgi:hypothetical protein